jgi:hypothetical protein
MTGAVLLLCKGRMMLFFSGWGFVLSDLNAPVEDFVACIFKKLSINIEND